MTIQPESNNNRNFGFRDKIGYLFGDWGNDFTFLLASSYLMVFYTNVLAVKPEHVGVLFLVARLIDAFTDIGWGRALDRMPSTSAGQFRPWILRGAIPVVLSSIFLYSYWVASWPYSAKIAFITLTYLLWGSVFYTVVNISYGALASALTPDAEGRAQLSVFRGIGANLAGVIISVIPPLFLYQRVNGNSVPVPKAFIAVAIVFGFFAIGFYGVCFFFTRERLHVRASSSQKENGKREDLVRRRALTRTIVSLLHNVPLLILILCNLLIFLSYLFIGNFNPYLWMDYFNNGKLSSIAGMVTSLPVLIVAPFGVIISRRIGKKELVGIGATFAGAIYICLFFLKVMNPYVFIAATMIAGLGGAFYTLLVWALVIDVIDEEEVRSGVREDGTVYAVNTWARKLAGALSGGISGFALGFIGYQAGQTTQTEGAIRGIYTCATLLPGTLYVIVGLIFIVFYPLSRSRVEANSQKLQER